MESGNLGDLDEETRQLHLKKLQQYLPGVNFPAGREEVASAAEERNGAPQKLVETIRNNNAPTSFNSLEELSEWFLGKYLETLQQYLPGVNFPAGREEVASAAEERNGAPQKLVETIRNNNAPTSFNSLVVLLAWLLGVVLAGKRPKFIIGLEDLLPQLPLRGKRPG